MTEDQLLAAYTRTVSRGEFLLLECLVLDMAADGTVDERWEEAARLSSSVTPRRLHQTRCLLLRRWRHFLHCDGCGRRVPAALMHRGSLCHSCGEAAKKKFVS